MMWVLVRKFQDVSVALLTIFIFGLWSNTGCAVIPESATLIIASTPSGVNVRSSDGWQCNTPCERIVPRDATFDLELRREGYESFEDTVQIPVFVPSRVGTYIGAGIGVFTGLAAAELGEALGSVMLTLLGGYVEPIELSTGEKLKFVASGVLVYGGIGYAIDRARDSVRANRPIRVDISLIKRNIEGNGQQTNLSDSTDVIAK